MIALRIGSPPAVLIVPASVRGATQQAAAQDPLKLVKFGEVCTVLVAGLLFCYSLMGFSPFLATQAP
jgi:hypothetical protein